MEKLVRTISVDPASNFAGLEFLSLMCWPAEPKRDAALVTFGSEVLGAAKVYAKHAEALARGKVPPEITARLSAAGITDWKLPERLDQPGLATAIAGDARRLGAEADAQLFDPAGGHSKVAAAPGTDAIIAQVTKAIEEGGAASGLILIVIARINAYHPFTASLARASAVVGELNCGKPNAFRGERSHKEDRSEWKASAPLWAGAMISGGYPWSQKGIHLSKTAFLNGIFDALDSGDALKRTLAYSHWFQTFALGHQSKGAGRPLLYPHEALPLSFTLPPRQPPLRPLNSEELAIAEDHRSYAVKKEAPVRKR